MVPKIKGEKLHPFVFTSFFKQPSIQDQKLSEIRLFEVTGYVLNPKLHGILLQFTTVYIISGLDISRNAYILFSIRGTDMKPCNV